jgi:AraC family L-rhamnose operon regulatory protein RhaS
MILPNSTIGGVIVFKLGADFPSSYSTNSCPTFFQQKTMLPIPLYQEENMSYRADTCPQLAKAARQGDVIFKSFARGQYPGLPIAQNLLHGLRTVGFWSAVTEQRWGLDWHRNEGIEITFLLSGKNWYETQTGCWELHVGDVTVCPPWQIHRIGNPNVGIGTLLWFIIDTQVRQNNQTPKWPSWIILSEEDKTKLIRLLLYHSSQVFRLSGKYVSTWQKLHRIIRDSETECPASLLAITLNELLYNFLEIRETDIKMSPDSFNELPRSAEMVQTFFQELTGIPKQLEHQWTLQEMARLCRISPTRFSLCCRQLTNLSPLNMLNQLRIRKAEKMIQEDYRKPIIEIAMECGFTTSQYFATVFKKWTGKTPTEYKKNLSSKKENE